MDESDERTIGEVVWTVERGAYSDHTVMCVCPEKAQAQAVADAYNAADDARDRAYLGSLPVVTRPERIVSYFMSVNVWDSGTTSDQRQNVREEFSFDMLWEDHARPVGWRWVRAPIHNKKGGRLEVFGTDLERVRKVFSDRRAQLLAGDPLARRTEARG